MSKYTKTLTNLNQAELMVEANKLRIELKKAQLDKIAGKLKNLRAVFLLRKKLAAALTYAHQAI